MLGIWDFENVGAVIGDAIVFQEILSVIAEENNVDKIDCCFVNPSVRNLRVNVFQQTNPKTIDNIISLTKINPKVGSVCIFDNNDQFSYFFQASKQNYIVFPNPYLPFSTVSNFHHLVDFYEKHKYLPKLTCDAVHLEWAKNFTEKHCAGKTLFCASIRKTNVIDPERNAPVKEWEKFFRYCNDKYPEFFFIIIGTEQEIHEELIGMKNILFAKQHNSTLLQDIAIIQSSKALLVHNSGMIVFSYYIDNVPSLLFGLDEKHIHFGHALKKGETYNFVAENHKMVWGTYTADHIIRHFDELVKHQQIGPA
ncbi:MAG: hypothetical protein GY754_02890 [bacterium]|nr:hypothetical protein [bacterium]